ncbi:hypothetical protein SMSP2_01527 [Limihaloglobus sulfuriphilus]|uniref:Uncharacterized protein n=1 Tax=Limihaloglobus sulfuriphilus TaxID=1851148 RepID=A0A1Q2MEN1_9BACT|nr:hypothetical protein SMSP2_01527 [Limihaloglobus sulfuriphilus]
MNVFSLFSKKMKILKKENNYTLTPNSKINNVVRDWYVILRIGRKIDTYKR